MKCMDKRKFRLIGFLLVCSLVLTSVFPWNKAVVRAVSNENLKETDGNITATGSALVATGEAITAVVGSPYTFQIPEEEEKILYTFTTGDTSRFYQQIKIETAEAAFDVCLYNEQGEFLEERKQIANQNIWRMALEKDTVYYLLITGAGGAEGTLLVSGIQDDYGNTLKEAGNIVCNRTYSVDTEVAGDVDVLAFRTQSAVSSYTITIEPSAGSSGIYEMYDGSGRRISSCSGKTAGKTVRFGAALTAGRKYYIRISSAETGRQVLVTVSQVTKKYRVSYRLNGGKNHRKNPSQYISTTGTIRFQNPVRRGYRFVGWYQDPHYRKRISAIRGSLKRDMTLYACWRKVTSGTTSVKSLKSRRKKQMSIRWKKVAGVNGYQLLYGTNKKLKKGARKKTTARTSLTLKKLKAGKKYYVRVRTYTRDSVGARVYGKYSKIKKVTVRQKDPKGKTKKSLKKKS